MPSNAFLQPWSLACSRGPHPSIFADKALSPFLGDGLHRMSIPYVTKNIWLTKDTCQQLFKAKLSFLKAVGKMGHETKKKGSRGKGTGTKEWTEATRPKTWVNHKVWPWEHINLNISQLLMHVLWVSYLTKRRLLFFRNKMGIKHL